jgi:hypothetical protein
MGLRKISQKNLMAHCNHTLPEIWSRLAARRSAGCGIILPCARVGILSLLIAVDSFQDGLGRQSCPINIKRRDPGPSADRTCALQIRS